MTDDTTDVECQDHERWRFLTQKAAEKRIREAIFAFPGHDLIIVCPPRFEKGPQTRQPKSRVIVEQLSPFLETITCSARDQKVQFIAIPGQIFPQPPITGLYLIIDQAQDLHR